MTAGEEWRGEEAQIYPEHSANCTLHKLHKCAVYITDCIRAIMRKESGAVVLRAESCLIERYYRDGIRPIMQNFRIRSASVIRRHKLAGRGIINLYCHNL